MSRRKALVVGVHAWDSPFQVGSHAIARGLAERGWQVGYVSAPITPFHWLNPQRSGFQERLAVHRKGGMIDPQTGVWHYVPFSLVAPDHRAVLNARWVFAHWQRLSIPNVIRVAAAQGFSQVDLLLMNSHFQPFWLDVVVYRRAVYRLADLTAGFAGCGLSAQAVETQIARRVDLVVAAAHGLAQPAWNMGARDVLVMPNGIRNQDFMTSDVPRPMEYRSMMGPVAIYVGAFGPWVDLGLIRACAQARPDMHFVLIGPADGLHGGFETSPNVHLLGSRSRKDLVPYLRHAHVGLMPFDRAACPALVDHVHPLKLYEYMACGLPVVSTDWAELRQFHHPAMICSTVDEFIRSLDSINSFCDEKLPRMEFAKSADWSMRIESLLDKIGLS